MFESIAAKLLNKYVNDYLHELEWKNIKIGLTGKVEFFDLSIRPEALITSDSSIVVRQAIVGYLTTFLKWGENWQSPLCLSIKDVKVVIVKNPATSKDSQNAEGSFRKREDLESCASENGEGVLQRLLNKIKEIFLNHVSVEVENISILYEDCDSSLSCGFFTQQLTVASSTINKDNNTFAKFLTLEATCLYLRNGTVAEITASTTEAQKDQPLKFFSEEDIVLKPTSMELALALESGNEETQLSLRFIAQTEINCHLSHEQLLTICKSLESFQNRLAQEGNHCGSIKNENRTTYKLSTFFDQFSLDLVHGSTRHLARIKAEEFYSILELGPESLELSVTLQEVFMDRPGNNDHLLHSIAPRYGGHFSHAGLFNWNRPKAIDLNFKTQEHHTSINLRVNGKTKLNFPPTLYEEVKEFLEGAYYHSPEDPEATIAFKVTLLQPELNIIPKNNDKKLCIKSTLNLTHTSTTTSVSINKLAVNLTLGGNNSAIYHVLSTSLVSMTYSNNTTSLEGIVNVAPVNLQLSPVTLQAMTSIVYHTAEAFKFINQEVPETSEESEKEVSEEEWSPQLLTETPDWMLNTNDEEFENPSQLEKPEEKWSISLPLIKVTIDIEDPQRHQLLPCLLVNSSLEVEINDWKQLMGMCSCVVSTYNPKISNWQFLLEPIVDTEDEVYRPWEVCFQMYRHTAYPLAYQKKGKPKVVDDVCDGAMPQSYRMSAAYDSDQSLQSYTMDDSDTEAMDSFEDLSESETESEEDLEDMNGDEIDSSLQRSFFIDDQVPEGEERMDFN